MGILKHKQMVSPRLWETQFYWPLAWLKDPRQNLVSHKQSPPQGQIGCCIRTQNFKTIGNILGNILGKIPLKHWSRPVTCNHMRVYFKICRITLQLLNFEKGNNGDGKRPKTLAWWGQTDRSMHGPTDQPTYAVLYRGATLRLKVLRTTKNGYPEI
jgi:hypothetical protein